MFLKTHKIKNLLFIIQEIKYSFILIITLKKVEFKIRYFINGSRIILYYTLVIFFW